MRGDRGFGGASSSQFGLKSAECYRMHGGQFCGIDDPF
jgi:hypothetical protein